MDDIRNLGNSRAAALTDKVESEKLSIATYSLDALFALDCSLRPAEKFAKGSEISRSLSTTAYLPSLHTETSVSSSFHDYDFY
jgi:hypothetical protein